MKILAPIRAYDELEMLAASGAEELYCGITPAEWTARYQGAVWLNRRSPKGSSLDSYAEMKQLVDGAHALRIPVFITLNAPYYAAEQIPLVIELARRLSEEIGVDALIVSDNEQTTGNRQKAGEYNIEAIEETSFLADIGLDSTSLGRVTGRWAQR